MLLGGARMLGPRVIGTALAEGWTVAVANRGSEPAGGYPAAVERVVVDRGDREGIAALMRSQDPDAIVDLSCYEPRWAELAIEALAAWTGRYLLMSSGAVYPETGTLPIGEETAPTGRPLWGEYGAKKVEIERLFRESALAPRTTVVRPPYIVDEGDFMERLPFIFDRLAAGVPVLVPDSGKACVQLVSAGDVAAACMRLLAAPQARGRAFNVGPRRVVTLESLVDICADALGVESSEVELVPLAQAGLGDRPYSWDDAIFPFADQHYVLDARDLDRAIGGEWSYEPVEELVARVARDYLSNPTHREPEEAPSEAMVRRDRGIAGLAARREAHA